MWESPPLSKLQEAIASPSNPIGMRMRAAYFLRQAYENAVRNEEDDPQRIVIDTLGQGLLEDGHGSLLRHEFAYVMGQLRDERCCEPLEKVLTNDSDCTMVRHECGEALGAIGANRSIPILESTIQSHPPSTSPEIGQTCELALAHMHWKNNRNNDNDNDNDEDPQIATCACLLPPYSSIDPAPPHPTHLHLTTPEIGSILQNPSLPLFERYRAMFSLRNRGGIDAVEQLGITLVRDDTSALLRHEVAYVLGQMQHSFALEFLAESLRRREEHAMVRHESAEALGALEGRWGDVEKVLEEFLEDEDVVVRESCVVALDAIDYWGGGGGGSKSAGDADGDVDVDGETVLEKEELGHADVSVVNSFVKQKAVTNGRREVDIVTELPIQQNQKPLLNHFNVVV